MCSRNTFSVLNRDEVLNMEEFTALCKALFRNEQGKSYEWVYKIIVLYLHMYKYAFIL